MKIFKNFIIINFLLLLLSCSVVKEGFQNPKKKSSENPGNKRTNRRPSVRN